MYATKYPRKSVVIRLLTRRSLSVVVSTCGFPRDELLLGSTAHLYVSNAGTPLFCDGNMSQSPQNEGIKDLIPHVS